MLPYRDGVWTLQPWGLKPCPAELLSPGSLLPTVAGEAKFKDISWFSPNGERLSPNQQRISVVRNDDFSSTLTIYNANIDDAGIYKCVVSSQEEGDSEATVNVKIFQKLMFKNAPTPQEFKEGDDAVIVCDVVSSLPPTIIWKHKGRDVILKKDVRFIVLSNNYLQIRGIKKTDEGTYRCEGRILARGEINFKDIQVIVNVPPSVRARQSTMNATANLSQAVTLACDADGFPEPTVTWTKDGEPVEEVEDEDKYSFNYDGSELVIRKVDKSDEAEYICIAENKAGEADATIHLKVFAKPKITYVENKTAMELEDQITLTCEASGDPIPSITWRTSTRNISNEEKTLDGRIIVRSHARVSSLTLKDIQYTDAGEYVCTASTPSGRTREPYAPKLQGPVAVYTWEGNQVNITCEVFAYPSAVISWFRDGQLLPSSNYSNIKIYNTPSASYLEVTPDSENDFGNYNCTAVNRIGQESSEFILVQADTPSSPSIGRVEPYSSSAQVEFEEPEATGGVPILRYKAEWRALGEPDWHSRLYDAKEANVEGLVTITGLKPETTYTVRLSAVNGKGVGELSLPAEFRTQPVREPSAPKLEGHIGEDGNSIKVNVIKQDDGGSPIRHYLIKYKAVSEGWMGSPDLGLPLASTSPASGLGTAAIIGILVVVFVALLVAVDVTCYFLNKCGLLMCIAVNMCGKSGPGAKGKDMEEGKAAFSKDESKEPIVEVRTEEERTPNHDGGKHTEPNETTPLTEPEHPADTAATVEDMLPSNSPTSETTTLTSAHCPPAAAAPAPAARPGHPGQGRCPAAPASQPPSSTPRVAPLVDLSDTPALLRPPICLQVSCRARPCSAQRRRGRRAKPGPKRPLPAPPVWSALRPRPSPNRRWPRPEKEVAQPSAVKSPTETPKNPSAAKSEAGAGSAANPSRNEDFKMDEGTFKPPDIDLAKDVFAALGTATPPAAAGGAGGQAPEPAAPAADSSAPAKTEKMPAEDKGAVQDRKSPPAEVKTVPNEATQTNENESKA
uniref:Neural cell adhesion molecule 1 n=1 Tax=Malurus cyaneus samueli TaxID=2593467 RepID=A0A8C5TCP6_9PASS